MIIALTIVAVIEGILLAFLIITFMNLSRHIGQYDQDKYEYRRRLKRLDDIILPHNFDIEYMKRIGPAFRKTRSLVHTRHKEFLTELANIKARLDNLEGK